MKINTIPIRITDLLIAKANVTSSRIAKILIAVCEDEQIELKDKHEEQLFASFCKSLAIREDVAKRQSIASKNRWNKRRNNNV